MAKAVLTITDDDGENLRFSIELDPPLKRGEQNVSGARALGLQLMDAVLEESRGITMSGAMDATIVPDDDY